MTIDPQIKSITEECNTWLAQLSPYREKINSLKNELYQFAPGKTNHETRLGIEHFHNQFHIQLINIHDLKHELRHYIQEAERINDLVILASNKPMKEKMDALINDLNQLEIDFHNFIKQ